MVAINKVCMVVDSVPCKVQNLQNLVWQICRHLFSTAKGKFYELFDS